MAASMFSLTALTGREASAQRTVVIGTVEMNWRVWMVLLWTFPVAILCAVALYPFLSTGSILIIPVVEMAAVYLIHRRTRSGLKLRTYQALWDRRRAALNTFYICGQPIDLAQDRFVSLMSASTPNPHYVPPTSGTSGVEVPSPPVHQPVQAAATHHLDDEPVDEMAALFGVAR